MSKPSARERLAAAAFAVVEQRVSEPLMNLWLLTSPAFRTTLVLVFIGAATVSVFAYCVPQR